MVDETSFCMIIHPGIKGIHRAEVKFGGYRLAESPEFLLWTEIAQEGNVGCYTETGLAQEKVGKQGR